MWTSLVRFKMEIAMKTLLVMCFVSRTQERELNRSSFSIFEWDKGRIPWKHQREKPKQDETEFNKPFHSAIDGKVATFPWPGTKYYRMDKNGRKAIPLANQSDFEAYLRKNDDTVSIKWPKVVSDLWKDKRVLEVTSYGKRVGKIVRKAGEESNLESAGQEIHSDIFWFLEDKVVGCYKEDEHRKGKCWRRVLPYTVDGYYCYPSYKNLGGGWEDLWRYAYCWTDYDCIRDQSVFTMDCRSNHVGNCKGTGGVAGALRALQGYCGIGKA